jgi:acyl transferase domain-containing protein
MQLDASYWCRNLRQPIQFDHAVAKLAENGCDIWIEVSPHPVLSAALSEHAQEGIAVASLQRDDGGLSRMLAYLGDLHVGGFAVDWGLVLAAWSGRYVDAPTYAFQRKRFWFDRDEVSIVSKDPSTETWLEELNRLPPAQREERLLEWVCNEIAAVLGLRGAAAVPPNSLLQDLGMRSPVAVELASRLARRSRRALPATFVYSYPTAREIAGALLERLNEEASHGRQRPISASNAVLGTEVTLSDDELFASVDALVRETEAPSQEDR